jgi:hypothetical protein
MNLYPDLKVSVCAIDVHFVVATTARCCAILLHIAQLEPQPPRKSPLASA